jgi:hypothetical protein
MEKRAKIAPKYNREESSFPKGAWVTRWKGFLLAYMGRFMHK